MHLSLRMCAAFLFCLSPLACTAQTSPAGSAAPTQVTPASGQSGTDLTARPLPSAPNSFHADSTINLVVVVTDKSGRPVTGLDLPDFTLLDNNQPSKILSFHAYSGPVQQADSPVEAIVLFDTVNTTFDAVSYTRQQVENFLRLNGGHLAVPVSIAWLTNDGIEGPSEPSQDGNALAAQLDASEGRLRSITRSAGAYGAIERFQLSTNMLGTLVRSESDKPGRKLLIWAGPGWPMLDAPNIEISNKTQQALFGEIVQLSTMMRLAHIDLYSISQGMSGPETFLYQSFVKGVKKVQQANIPNLGLKVLAVQSGGLVLPPTNDVASAIKQCLQDADAFYTLSFEPPPADGPNQYHELKVRIGTPGLTARTNTGYYDQPEQPSAP
jgi:VWFA-related protein